MIANVIIHLINDLPVLADIEELPGPADRSIRCTNVRTVDGKRPSFVHDSQGIFVIPLGVIRLIEAPATQVTDTNVIPIPEPSAPEPPVELDEEAEEDLLARIRSL